MDRSGARRTRILAAALMVLWAGAAGAQAVPRPPTDDDGPPQPPQHRLFFSNLLALRYNPLGAIEELRFSYRYRLYDHEHRALRDNFAGIGVVPSFTPASLRLGVFAEIQPVSFLVLSAQYEGMRYFGA